VNAVISAALAAAEPLAAWPGGSIIVKDGFSGAELEIIAIMEKRNDGWYFAEFDAEDNPDYSGHPDICIDCHKSGSDFVRAFQLP